MWSLMSYSFLQAIYAVLGVPAEDKQTLWLSAKLLDHCSTTKWKNRTHHQAAVFVEGPEKNDIPI